jgi:hypothetical protein
LSLVSSAHRRHSRAKVRHSSAGMKRPSTRTKRTGEKSRWWEQKDTTGTSRPARRYPPSMGQIVGWVGSQYDSTPKKFRRRCHNSEGGRPLARASGRCETSIESSCLRLSRASTS